MPHWQAWRDAGFVDALRHRAGLPVLVKNDAPASSFVACYVGRGTGAGLIIDAAAIIRLHQLRDHRPMQWLRAASDTLRDLTAVFAVLFAPEFIPVGVACRASSFRPWSRWPIRSGRRRQPGATVPKHVWSRPS